MPLAKRASPELNLLVAALRLSLKIPGAEQELTCGLSAPDWHRVLWLGRREGVLLHLRQALITTGLLSGCPPEIASQLQAFAEVNRLRRLERTRELCLLLDALTRPAVPTVLIAPRISPTQDAWSEAEESDNFFHFYVPFDEQPRAVAGLHLAGHATDAPPEALVRAGRHPVFFNRGLAAHPKAARLAALADRTTLAGRELRTLASAHALLTPLRPGQFHGVPPLALARNTVHLCAKPMIAAEAFAEAACFGLREEWRAHVAACFQRLALAPPPEFTVAEPARLSEPTGTEPSDPPPHSPFLPTPSAVLERMLALADLQPTDVVYDLGCGDGRIVFRALESGVARAIGIDDNARLIEDSRARAATLGAGTRAEFLHGDFFTTDIRAASVVFCYLLPAVMPPLLSKLLRECRPGTRIVAHDYIFGDWPPERTELVRTGLTGVAQIYLWRVPPRSPNAG